MSTRILVMDVAFAHLGWAVMERGKVWRCVDSGVLETRKSDKKLKVRSADDSVQRCLELFRGLFWKAREHDVKAVVAELPTGGSKNSAASRAMGMASAVAACVVEVLDVPVEWTTPEAGKKAATGRKNASKAEMMSAMSEMFPGSTKGFKKKRGSDVLWENKYEHVADALAAFESAKGGQLVRLMEKL